MEAAALKKLSVLDLLTAHRDAERLVSELRWEVERRTGMSVEEFTDGMRKLVGPVEVTERDLNEAWGV